MGLVASYRNAFRGLPREVWILSGAALINRSGTMVLPFLALYLTQARGRSVPETGFLLALYAAGSLGGIALGGRLTDRLGPKPVLVASLALGGLSLVALGQARSDGALAVCVVVFGLLMDAHRPASMAAVAASAPAEATPRAFSLQRLAINVGMTIGPAVGGFLARVDYAWLFRVDGATCLAAAVYVALAYPARETEHDAHTGAAHAPSPLRDRAFLAAILLLFLQLLVFLQLMGTLPLFLRERLGFDERAIGLLFAVNTVTILLVEMQVVHAVERRDALRVTGVASLLVGLGFGLLVWARSAPAVALTILVWTAGEMLGWPVISGWVAGRARAGNRGRYMAAFTLVFSLAALPAPIAGTAVYERFGPDALWAACLAIGVLDLAGFWWLASSGVLAAGVPSDEQR
jgi:predicted MFS family arabinose efflux permease